jgi:hypothetical protein
MSKSFDYKSIFVSLFIITGMFISIYSGVLLIILAILEPNIPDSHTHLAWVSSSFTLTLNIFIIGLGILIGSIIYNRLSPTDNIFVKIKEGLFRIKVRKFRIIIKTGSFMGALLTSYMFGYFISFIIFYNIYNFSAIEIAELFLYPLVICILIFQVGAFISSIGLYIIKDINKIYKFDTNNGIPRFLTRGNRIFSSLGIINGSILILIFGMGIYAFNWHWFIGFYPPSPYTWEYMGLTLGFLSISIFIFIYGFQYYLRLNWYVKKHSEITRINFKKNKKIIAPIFAMIALVIMFIPFPPYLYIALYLIFMISQAWPIAWWDIYVTYSLIFFSGLIILIGIAIIFSPRRTYEIKDLNLLK